MNYLRVLNVWKKTLLGRKAALSIEITRECPLRCPGCYAYEDNHLGGQITLRQLSDLRGDELVNGVLALVRKHKPIHVSIVGGEPLVRYQELQVLLPKLDAMGINVRLVTSAVRPLPKFAPPLKRLEFAVSIDGLQPEHDARRTPATYERILKNVENNKIVIHCTITGQMMKRQGYLEEFLRFWSSKQNVRRIWISMFTPQKGFVSPECLSEEERSHAVKDLLRLRKFYAKLDMPEKVIREFCHPPKSPAECIFAQTTHTISADLKTEITPCQFGGNPDCSRCGCIASMGAAAIGRTKVLPWLTAGKIFQISRSIGKLVATLRN